MNIDVNLGKRQQEIAEHIAFGYSIKETADILNTPINTVKATLKPFTANWKFRKLPNWLNISIAGNSVCLFPCANLPNGLWPHV